MDGTTRLVLIVMMSIAFLKIMIMNSGELFEKFQFLCVGLVMWVVRLCVRASTIRAVL